MGKKYNIFIISRLYLKSYYKFLITNTDITKTEDAYSLFMYSMKKLYGLEVFEYSSCIEKYGNECIEFLNSLPDTPRVKNKVPYEDKVKIVSVCEGYAQAVGILTREVIGNSRIVEE